MLYSFPCPLPSPPARPLSSAICNIRGTFHSFIPAQPGCFCLHPAVPPPPPSHAHVVHTEPVVEQTVSPQGLGCFKPGSVFHTHSVGGCGTPWISGVSDLLNQGCNVARFLLTVPFLHMLCQSLPFAGQLFFYQFPWRCACVFVCLRVRASEDEQ